MVEHRIGQAAFMMGGRKGQERRLAAGECEDRWLWHGYYCAVRPRTDSSARSACRNPPPDTYYRSTVTEVENAGNCWRRRCDASWTR